MEIELYNMKMRVSMKKPKEREEEKEVDGVEQRSDQRTSDDPVPRPKYLGVIDT
jgi:hypothetical protein